MCEVMIKLLWIMFVVAFISCDPKPDISGHWVSIPHERGGHNYYRTIDINGSSLIHDIGSLTQTYRGETFIVRQLNLKSVPDFEGKEKLENLFGVYYPDYPIVRDSVIPSYAVTLRNDTLVVYGDIFSGQYYTRREPDVEADLFADLVVQIELPDSRETPYCDSLGFLHPSFISLGKNRFNLDTIALQVNDVFIGPEILPQYLTTEMYRYELKEKSQITVVLSVDQNVPGDLVEKVVESIHSYDAGIRIRFPLIDRKMRKICYVDSLLYFEKYFHK